MGIFFIRNKLLLSYNLSVSQSLMDTLTSASLTIRIKLPISLRDRFMYSMISAGTAEHVHSANGHFFSLKFFSRPRITVIIKVHKSKVTFELPTLLKTIPL